MEDTRLPKCVLFGELVGSGGCVGVQEKEWIRCFHDDLRAFGINAGPGRRTGEQEAERFMAKRIAAEKARTGLRHAVVCPNVTGRTKERIAKKDGFVLVCSP